MKAIQYNDYGNSDVLEQVDVPAPSVQNGNDVLVQVKAAGVNPIDIKIRMGFMKAVRPVEMPFIPGGEAAGIVVAIGDDVSAFKVGDEVIALTGTNAYAEYVTANESFVVPKPKGLSFAEAASIGVNIGTAQSVLFITGKLEKGQSVLIQGGSGAVGGAMVQMAKAAGAYVIATASGKGVALAKSFGADEVIDYKLQDVARVIKDIDLVADTAGGEAQAKLFQVLKPGGVLLSIVIPPSQELADQYKVNAGFVASNISAQTLQNGIELLKIGKFKPVVSKIFKLEEAAVAQDFLTAGGINGKVILTID
ncbi:Alcohol dehydrogenase [Pedobacter sp. Bi27]|uniref:NADP-dependent oxidoreductase n=1 Tax=unclassified Pedobacter TaxID=2628915 RepID=UPI001D594B87|nr:MULTISPECIES: NADP-dependent oxidoreductase [unclassified Pedobacter]CAH0177000.1 Alcohol dehydrogenase [Pedobacter sp. Bi36]CAH0201197.1 Alcohol dehydrogenase [Pedobacter sp. Bi27]CAH0232860.1 Alcohol dehydrogenase [Pedobacter sp. Bi126]